jgi:Ca2+/Na+ antiporter
MQCNIWHVLMISYVRSEFESSQGTDVALKEGSRVPMNAFQGAIKIDVLISTLVRFAYKLHMYVFYDISVSMMNHNGTLIYHLYVVYLMTPFQ